MTTVPHVYKAALQVKRYFAANGISKDSVNESQRWKFRSIDDVMAELSAQTSLHGLLFKPGKVLDSSRSDRTDSKGKPWQMATVTVRFDIISSEDGSSDFIEVTCSALDNSDKALSKAMSAALKNAAIYYFNIPVRGLLPEMDFDSPEYGKPGQQHEAKQQPDTAPEHTKRIEAAIYAAATRSKRTAKEITDALLKVAKAGSVADISQERIDGAIKWLEKTYTKFSAE